mmetsp:Transcript_5511/g.12791  ORF Transcript_5511/g.12791 Transcript_5511/m.12791 type:complete len:410 (-) Transcript_5511:110-1339(-)
MCGKKILIFEQLRLHTDCAHELEGRTVDADQELLLGAMSVDGAASNLLKDDDPPHAAASNTGGLPTPAASPVDEEEEDPAASAAIRAFGAGKFPFHMDLPPPGTDTYEEDLLYLESPGPVGGGRVLPSEEGGPDAPGDGEAARTARRAGALAGLLGGPGWKRASLVLTNDRALHLLDLGEAQAMRGAASRAPQVDAGSEGAAEAAAALAAVGRGLRSPSRSADSGDPGFSARGFGGGGAFGEVRCCFEARLPPKQAGLTSTLGLGPPGVRSPWLVFKAPSRRSAEVWLALLAPASRRFDDGFEVDLGDPLAVAECAETTSSAESSRARQAGPGTPRAPREADLGSSGDDGSGGGGSEEGSDLESAAGDCELDCGPLGDFSGEEGRPKERGTTTAACADDAILGLISSHQ